MLVNVMLGAAMMLTAQQQASAQSWPSKPIKVIVPISAGSAADIVPRLIFEQVASTLGQPIVVENRPGAGGTIGAAAVAKADLDGHTLLAMSSSYTIAPAVYKSLPYDAKQDLRPGSPSGAFPTPLSWLPRRASAIYRALSRQHEQHRAR